MNKEEATETASRYKNQMGRSFYDNDQRMNVIVRKVEARQKIGQKDPNEFDVYFSLDPTGDSNIISDVNINYFNTNVLPFPVLHSQKKKHKL